MIRDERFALKGNIIYAADREKLTICEQSWLVCEDQKIEGVYQELPERFRELPKMDYGDRILIPGLVDLHIHAPQYAFRGMGMDLELLDWLDAHTFPEEARYENLSYAKRAYQIFADHLRAGATTRACVFATIHRESTILLMDLLEKAGLNAMVGKVNMDRNSPNRLRETAKESEQETIQWIKEVQARGYQNVRPILTPRFIPSCTDDLMHALKSIQVSYDLPVQSHLSENPGEVAWVQELCPQAEFYGDAYDRLGLFGRDCKTIMAHCVYSGDREIERIKENGVFIAHCPESNINLSSGVAPVRRFLNEGLRVGLGSDVAAGSTSNLFYAMACAIRASKMRWRLQDDSEKCLTIPEVFYLATKGGGAFWGNTGSFEKGYEADIVVLDDQRLVCPNKLDVRQRLERIIYLADEREVYAKFAAGKQIF